MATAAGGIDIPEADARLVIAIPKTFFDDISWSPEPDKAANMTFSARLLDENGATIPGLLVVMDFRTPPRVDDCKYRFTLFTTVAGQPKRAYQLEVRPDSVRSSNHHGEIRGPHQHTGDLVEAVRIPNLGCKQHEAWFRVFLDRANIRHNGRYFGPFEGGLFA